MSFVAIMAATPDDRVAKFQAFPTQADAAAHIALFAAKYPDAFTAPEPPPPDSHWLVDVTAKTIAIVPPPPPDWSAIDQATVDRLLLDSGVMRAMGLLIFEIGKAGKTGDWSFFDGVADVADFKVLFAGMIR